MRIPLLLAFAAMSVTSCVAPEPKPAPPPAPAPKPAMTINIQKPVMVTLVQPKGHWLDWPIAPGVWVYRQDERGSIALFGRANENALVTLRCDRQRGRVYLSRSTDMGGSELTVRTSSISKAVSVQPTGGGQEAAYVAAELLPTDPLLDAIAYSRGRVALEIGGVLNIAIPVWAEIGRVTEDCRAR